MKIGVGVEGPSDRKFWEKVLPKHFRSASFDIHCLNNRQKLIREAPRLLSMFRDLHYGAGFILLDQDDAPCFKCILDEFPHDIKDEASKPIVNRFLFVCAANRQLEAWFLADTTAIKMLLPRAKHSSPIDTGCIKNPSSYLEDLWKQQHKGAAFNKKDFATEMAPKFMPKRARSRSKSFDHFWKRITEAVKSNTKVAGA